MADLSPRSRRRGNFAIIMAISLTILLGFTALAIDVSAALVVQAELQNAGDAAAHAAVQYLDGTSEGVTLARKAALDVAAMNRTLISDQVALDENLVNATDGGVVFGYWDTSDGSFSASDDPTVINAVQIFAAEEDVAFLLPALSYETKAFNPTTLSAAAQLVTGAGSVECYIPLAISDCLFDEHGVDGIQDVTLILNPAGIDNTGWSRAGGSAPNASWLSDHIMNCTQDGEVSVGDPINLDNGVKSSVLQTMVDRIESSDSYWDDSVWGDLPDQHEQSGIDPDAYGQVYDGPIFVFNNPDYCSGGGGSWTTTEEITGFVWAAIYDVVDQGSAAEKNVYVRLNTTDEFDFGTGGGGANYGITYTSHGLVR